MDAIGGHARTTPGVIINTHGATNAISIDDVDLVVVANRPDNHHGSGLWAIERGLNVLMEKPMGVSTHQIADLIERAEARDVLLMTSNLPSFRAGLVSGCERMGVIATGHHAAVSIVWSDAMNEQRYGMTVRYHQETPAIRDVMPHVVCIIRMLGLLGPITAIRASQSDDGNAALLGLRVDGIPVDAQISRSMPRRRRVIGVESDGVSANLDFSEGPAIMSLVSPSGTAQDAMDAGGLGSLQASIDAALASLRLGHVDSRLDVRHCWDAAWTCDEALRLPCAPEGLDWPPYS
jgi:hypothetical protein